MNFIEVTHDRSGKLTQVNINLISHFTSNLSGTVLYFIGSDVPLIVTDSYDALDYKISEYKRYKRIWDK